MRDEGNRRWSRARYPSCTDEAERRTESLEGVSSLTQCGMASSQKKVGNEWFVLDTITLRRD